MNKDERGQQCSEDDDCEPTRLNREWHRRIYSVGEFSDFHGFHELSETGGRLSHF